MFPESVGTDFSDHDTSLFREQELYKHLLVNKQEVASYLLKAGQGPWN